MRIYQQFILLLAVCVLPLFAFCNKTSDQRDLQANTAILKGKAFDPWDKTKWASHYDASGKLTKPFQISEDVYFVKRETPWKPEFGPAFSSPQLFEVARQGIEFNGNGVVIDITTPEQNQSLEDLYKAGATPWTNGAKVNAIHYQLEKKEGTAETVIKNFTIKGFDRGIRLGNPGIAHPVIIDSCTLARNRFALYTNGNNAVVQNSSLVENGYSAVYAGSQSNTNMFRKNIFRDNVLFQSQPSYGEFIGDAFYKTDIVDNVFERSLVANSPFVHIGVSIYRNAGEDNKLRREIPHHVVIENNKFEGYSIAVHLASRMGRYPSYDISKEGRDYAFYHTINNNDIIDCSIGIKVNSEGNTIDGNRFVNTNYEIVLHPVFYTVKNTTINNQPNNTVHIWYLKSDYSEVLNQAYLFRFHDNANASIPREHKRVEVFSTIGTPEFAAVDGLNDNEFVLNPRPPDDILWHHRAGNPLMKKYGEFQENLSGNEIVAIWNEKTTRIRNQDYYNIVIYDQYGTEINRGARSEVGWSQIAVGYFTRTAGEMEIAAVPKEAINGKYPVYIFRRGFAEPRRILHQDNTNPNIKISTDTNHQLQVTF